MKKPNLEVAAVMVRQVWDDFQPLGFVALTPRLAARLLPLSQDAQAPLWYPAGRPPLTGTTPYTDSLRQHLAHLWPQSHGLVLGVTLGACVRLIAPLLQNKDRDPAVVVVDPAGRYVLSVCGGHRQEGDRLARAVAEALGATAILSDQAGELGVPGLDTWGITWGWHRGPGDWTVVAAALATQEPLAVIQESGSRFWRGGLPADLTLVEGEAYPDAPRVYITSRLPQTEPRPAVWWHPKVLWVGVGCERHTHQSVLEQGLDTLLANHNLTLEAVAGLATVDRKADEPAVLDLCQARGWPLRVFTAAELAPVPVPHPSAVVAATVGTPSVAEAAALTAAGVAQLRVPKQIYRAPGQPGAVTLAIAEAPQEWIGRPGQLYLVGLGPGALDQMTLAARTVLGQVDVVIGYHYYLDLVRSLGRPGQVWEGSPIGQEWQRAARAVELARWGLRVAVVSSGDCGIYGMAGLVLETLMQQAWDGQSPGLEVLPGVTALQAAAARLGAPLMQDFCAVSLSDLHIPWAVIEQRLQGAAQGDFVTALYNPKSAGRPHYLQAAQGIFLAHRPPTTPVAVVRHGFRPEEALQISTLAHLDTLAVDMFCTVLIGNSQTFQQAGWLVTPRQINEGHSGQGD